MEESRKPAEKSSREIFTDFGSELIGFEHGMFRTFVDLRKRPAVVLNDYITPGSDYQYVGPFKLLFTCLSFWIFFNSFVIDWYKVWYDICISQFKFISDILNIPPDRQAQSSSKMIEVASVYSRFAGDFFSKFYVPIIVTMLPLASWFAFLFTRKKYNVSFRRLLVVNTYCVATSSALMGIVGIGLALKPLITFILLGVAMILMLFGKNYIQLTAFRTFFTDHGPAIEKRMFLGNLLAMLIVVLLLVSFYFVESSSLLS